MLLLSLPPVRDKLQSRGKERDQIRDSFLHFLHEKTSFALIRHNTHQQRERRGRRKKSDCCQERKVHTHSHGSYIHHQWIILTLSLLYFYCLVSPIVIKGIYYIRRVPFSLVDGNNAQGSFMLLEQMDALYSYGVPLNTIHSSNVRYNSTEYYYC